jgi:hypothetical protein
MHIMCYGELGFLYSCALENLVFSIYISMNIMCFVELGFLYSCALETFFALVGSMCRSVI